MERRATAAGLVAALVALACAGTAAAPAQTPELGDRDAAYDAAVQNFIQYDIGNIRDRAAIERIRARFNAIRSDDAVPALVRGLNTATRMRASCPITALAGKLRGILGLSKDPEVGTYVLRHLEKRQIAGYTHHINAVFDSAEQQIIRIQAQELAAAQRKRRFEEQGQRLAYVPGRRLTELAVRDPGPDAAQEPPHDSAATGPMGTSRKGAATDARERSASLARPPAARSRTITELIDGLSDRSTQLGALDELYRRASANDAAAVAAHAESIARVLKHGDDAAQESAARLLGLLRSATAVPALIDALADSSPPVRSAAATALARTTRQLFGPSDNATASEIAESIARWRDWWKRANTTTPDE